MFITILKDKRVYLPIAILAACVLVAAVLVSLRKPPEEKEAVQVAPLVKVETVQFAPMQLEVSSHGLVTPKYQTTLVAQVGGAISVIAPEFVRGGFVKKGQILARIEDSDYQAYVVEARAALLSARAGLEQEEALSAVARDEWSRIKDRKPTALSLRKPQLAQEQARVNAAEAALARAEKNLERTTIRAPYHGLVAARNVGLGSYANPGSVLGELLSVSQAEVRLPVADNQLQFLLDRGVGADAELMGNLEGVETRWAARIVRSEGVIDDQSRMAYLVAEVTNPYGLQIPNDTDPTINQSTSHPLRFGSYVQVVIKGINVAKATLVPRYLVKDGRVPVLNAERKLAFKKVESIREQGTDMVIVDGLADQDLVIVSALQYPVDGMALRLLGDIDEPKTPSPETDDANTEALAKKAD